GTGGRAGSPRSPIQRTGQPRTRARRRRTGGASSASSSARIAPGGYSVVPVTIGRTMLWGPRSRRRPAGGRREAGAPAAARPVRAGLPPGGFRGRGAGEAEARRGGASDLPAGMQGGNPHGQVAVADLPETGGADHRCEGFLIGKPAD